MADEVVNKPKWLSTGDVVRLYKFDPYDHIDSHCDHPIKCKLDGRGNRVWLEWDVISVSEYLAPIKARFAAEALQTTIANRIHARMKQYHADYATRDRA